MLLVENLLCEFPDGRGRRLRALHIGRLELPCGAARAVTGPSGSGKSTFFHCLSGLLRPAAGRIAIGGEDITAFSAGALAKWRAAHVGYIFQQALLLPYLTVMENILLAADIAGLPRKEARTDADMWLRRCGLAGFGHRMPARLSGGEKQRVGFIRAILRRPRLLLADEPTASLDAASSRLIMEFLMDYQRESGATFLCATHDPAVAALFPASLRLEKGELRP